MKEQKIAKVPEMPTLPDTKGDRQLKEVVPPIHKPLSAELLFGPGNSAQPRCRQEAELEDIIAPFQERRTTV